MQVTETLNEGLKRAYSIKLTADELDTKVNEKLNEAQPDVEMKGFRKGKVPRDVLIRKAGDALLSEAAERIIGEAVQEAIQAAENPPIRSTRPRVEAENPLTIGSAFNFDLIYDTKPQVSLGNYQGVNVTRPIFRIEDADLDRELENIREQNAVVVEKQSDTVETGDVVEID